ncbi:hypothetical protein PFDG_04691 [Plasmodium falciparum Dd2]|uniref:Uncharacterized protein n=1 Tax=Plasmodium falciparum (isolate Dd2) TaxID=57267 RepID=A0A0L7M5R5_PLAF4|nr:hypothetical protein PFDG_04691 [Plasmodium falciparum Dd2]
MTKGTIKAPHHIHQKYQQRGYYANANYIHLPIMIMTHK